MTRKHEKVLARQKQIYNLHKQGKTLHEIAAIIGLEHTTVFYGINKIKTYLETGYVKQEDL